MTIKFRFPLSSSRGMYFIGFELNKFLIPPYPDRSCFDRTGSFCSQLISYYKNLIPSLPFPRALEMGAREDEYDYLFKGKTNI